MASRETHAPRDGRPPGHVPPLSPVERAFLAYDAAHPRVNLAIGGLTLMRGRAPALGEVRRWFRDRLPSLPRLSSALVPAGRRRSAWLPLDRDALTALVGERVLAPEQGHAGLVSAVDGLLQEAIPRGGPMWRAWLLHGHAEDEFALLYLGHHALHDGMSIPHRVAGALLGAEPAGPPPPGRRAQVRHRPSLRETARGGVNLTRGFWPLARPEASGVWTGERRLTWTFTDLDLLRHAAGEHRTTVNTIFLAGLTTVLREWPGSPWYDLSEPVRRPWALVPMNTRGRPGDGVLGNRFVPFRIQLPCDEPSPARRLAILHAATERGKGDGRTAAESGLGAVMPGWLARTLVELTQSSRHSHLLATNVPGPDRPLQLAGRPVTGFVPVSYLPAGQPLGAALTTYRETACVAFVTDSGCPDPGDLGDRWLHAVRDLASTTRRREEAW
ncbi:wax ester/triacylglycerol synthase family O-acyltransferase [Actinoallomurus bryophytorum]|uniref:diacylglycerol O-acyltransferase n=1 Tax=Actinoallomurus bryophytorum TaxID=1490222 RepID=A0A543CJ04_9ACTN|nr:WS/DGAT domain-containing protein [Actinoallomurus bryophytorum]TQL97076.1 diacylglycerol O-acyltransferase [Actinoallomurus bryophytorum]